MREDGLDRCRMFIGERVGELRVCGCVSLSDVVLGVGSEMGLTLQGVAHSGSMCVFLSRAVVWCHEWEGGEEKQTCGGIGEGKQTHIHMQGGMREANTYARKEGRRRSKVS